MATISGLSINDRPREKALKKGIEVLSDAELIAILIGSGYEGVSAIEVSENMIISSGGLVGLFSKTPLQFETYKGIGKAKCTRLSAVIELAKRYKIAHISDSQKVLTPMVIFERYKHRVGMLNEEVVMLLICDNNLSLLHEELLYKGTEDKIFIDHIEIIKRIIFFQGKKYYIIHNHPKGSLIPSSFDVLSTSQLDIESKRLKLFLEDHLILTKEGFYSFKEGRSYLEKEINNQIDSKEENT